MEEKYIAEFQPEYRLQQEEAAPFVVEVYGIAFK